MFELLSVHGYLYRKRQASATLTLLGLLTLTLLSSVGARAQKTTPSGVKPMPAPTGSIQDRTDGSKPAPASLSHRKTEVKPLTKLYPASSEETADAILADSLGSLFLYEDEHFHKGEYNHCINLSKIVVQGDPHNVDAYSNSAWLLWSTERNDQAIAFLKEGIKTNPDTYYMYDELGTHYWIHLHDAVSALPYLEQAVKHKGALFTTWSSLARCYEKTNQWDKAVSAWQTTTKFPDAAKAEDHLRHAIAERDKHRL